MRSVIFCMKVLCNNIVFRWSSETRYFLFQQKVSAFFAFESKEIWTIRGDSGTDSIWDLVYNNWQLGLTMLGSGWVWSRLRERDQHPSPVLYLFALNQAHCPKIRLAWVLQTWVNLRWISIIRMYHFPIVPLKISFGKSFTDWVTVSRREHCSILSLIYPDSDCENDWKSMRLMWFKVIIVWCTSYHSIIFLQDRIFSHVLRTQPNFFATIDGF